MALAGFFLHLLRSDVDTSAELLRLIATIIVVVPNLSQGRDPGWTDDNEIIVPNDNCPPPPTQ